MTDSDPLSAELAAIRDRVGRATGEGLLPVDRVGPARMPDAIPVPPEAATLATDDLTAWMVSYGWLDGLRTVEQIRSVCEAIVDRVLENGAPLIAAAERRRIGEASFSPDEDDRTGLFRLARADGVLVERERLRQLAARVDAVYPDLDAPGLTLSFARLIGDQDA